MQTPVLAIALLLPSLFTDILLSALPWHYLDSCHGIAFIDTVLIGLIDRRIGNWLLVMIGGLDLGCLALAKNAIEDRKIAIKEPRHV